MTNCQNCESRENRRAVIRFDIRMMLVGMDDSISNDINLCEECASQGVIIYPNEKRFTSWTWKVQPT